MTLAHATTPMNLDDNMLSKISQMPKGKYHVILLSRTYSNQIHRNRKENGTFQGLEGGEMDIRCLMETELQPGIMKTSWKERVVGWMFLMPLNCVLEKDPTESIFCHVCITTIKIS